jgi:hypothetical protein
MTVGPVQVSCFSTYPPGHNRIGSGSPDGLGRQEVLPCKIMPSGSFSRTDTRLADDAHRLSHRPAGRVIPWRQRLLVDPVEAPRLSGSHSRIRFGTRWGSPPGWFYTSWYGVHPVSTPAISRACPLLHTARVSGMPKQVDCIFMLSSAGITVGFLLLQTDRWCRKQAKRRSKAVMA